MKMRVRPGIFRLQHGSSLIEVAIALPVLLLFLTGVVDFGRAYYLSNEVVGAAHAGAVYGSQFPASSTSIVDAAKLDAPDVPGLTATASYGCECWDGFSSSASCSTTPACSTNIVYYVTVTATATYTPLFPWPGIPSSITLSRSTTMRSGSS